jgi:hypothetical protein
MLVLSISLTVIFFKEKNYYISFISLFFSIFMISNLLENQRQTFPSNIDNLTVLLMDKLDQNKRQLQKDIQEVLDKLVEESIIREDKGSYFFFKRD